MLFSVLPFSVVFSSVWPSEYTLTLLFIIKIVALVLAAISPREHSLAVHFVVHPLTFVSASIRPGVNSNAMDVVVNELSCVCRSISPVEFSVSVFLSFFILRILCVCKRKDSTTEPYSPKKFHHCKCKIKMLVLLIRIEKGLIIRNRRFVILKA